MDSKTVLAYAVLITLGACTATRTTVAPDSPAQLREQPAERTGVSAEDADPFEQDQAAAGQARANLAPADLPGAAPRREAIIERGTGEFVRTADPSPPDSETAGPFDLRFDGVDIGEFIQVVLGDLLGENFVIDPQVAGQVTLFTNSPVDTGDLLPLFEQALSIHGAVLVRGEGLYRVMSATNPRLGEAVPTVSSRGGTPGRATQIIPLQFIAAQELLGLLEPMVADPSTLRADAARNLLFATGSQPEIQTILEAVAIFDVEWLRGMSVGLFPLDHVAPDTLAGELAAVLDGLGGVEPGSGLNGLVRVVPIQRLGSLLVVSATPAALREAETWLRRLDRPGDSAGRQLFVYPVQNAAATELAQILGSVFQDRPTGRQADPESGGLAPGLTPVRIGAEALDAAPPGEGLPLSPGGAIDVIADDIRNALVVLASPQDYRIVEAAIRRLDTVPLQVLIEASIVEVSLRDNLSFGVEWFFRNSFDGVYPARGQFDAGSAGIAPLSPGFSYTIVENPDQAQFVLNALAGESEVNVLSAPSLMVLDNQEATINVGDEIPVPTRQSVSNINPDSPTVNEIDFRQTGVTLTVRPRVNDSGLVTMDIRQEVATAAATTTSNLDAPTIQNRLIESVVAVNSGDTVVLGGLMQDQASASQTGVPVLRRIPLFGRLFRQTNDETFRTELVVLITPRVVRDREDARRIADEFREKMRELRPEAAAPQTQTPAGRAPS